jgi:integrase
MSKLNWIIYPTEVRLQGRSHCQPGRKPGTSVAAATRPAAVMRPSLPQIESGPPTIPSDSNMLLSPDRAAAQMGITVEQLLKFARDGALKSINLGRGEKKPRYRFDPIDIDVFKKARTQEHHPCPSLSRKNPRHTIGTASRSNVIGFSALRAARRAKRQTGSKPERDKARVLLKATKRLATSLAIEDVAARLWHNNAQHDADPDATFTNLERLVDHFGKRTLLTEIDHVKAQRMVAWRRGQRIKGRKDAPLISNATVNRSTTKVLQRLFTFAESEGAVFEHKPKWDDLLLPEPVERVRELQDGEAEAIDASMRDDYEPFFAYARASGMRLKECVTLRWSEVNFGTKQIVRTGKGGRRIVFPITDTIREIIFPLQGNHPDFVFTYVAIYGNKKLGIVRGQRYRLTVNGAKSAWQRLRADAGLADFRFHDFRHDFGSKLLRDTGNLKLVQKALNHADIKSTLRYAHVLDGDVADAVERVARARPRNAGKNAGKIREVAKC